jgi:hypothetical protein
VLPPAQPMKPPTEERDAASQGDPANLFGVIRSGSFEGDECSVVCQFNDSSRMGASLGQSIDTGGPLSVTRWGSPNGANNQLSPVVRPRDAATAENPATPFALFGCRDAGNTDVPQGSSAPPADKQSASSGETSLDSLDSDYYQKFTARLERFHTQLTDAEFTQFVLHWIDSCENDGSLP